MGGVGETEKHTVVTGTCASCGRSDVKVSTAQVGPTMLLRSARVPGDPRQVYDTSIVCSLTGWQGLAALAASVWAAHHPDSGASSAITSALLALELTVAVGRYG